jgi:hypothetical protein
MQFTLKREIISNKATLGSLFNDKGLELAKSIEPPFMDNKQEISCIPFGVYKCKKDNTGKYRFWKVLNVEGRDAIEMHVANFASELRGCIAFGQSWSFMSNPKTNKLELSVTSSGKTFEKLKEILPDEFELTIVS